MARNQEYTKIIMVLFSAIYLYFFYVLCVVIQEATIFTNRMLFENTPSDSSRISQLSAIYPRTFQPRTIPCFLEKEQAEWWQPGKNNPKQTEGFFFLKPHKTGSSTAAGIHLRIARNIAAKIHGKNKRGDYSMCRVQYDHSPAQKMNYAERSKRNSFLWTIIREPTERAISHFFHFQVSRKGANATDESFENYLLSNQARTDGYYLRMLSMSGTTQNPAFGVQNIIEEYDFIAIMERMDESLVALQMLLGLSTADILYVASAKENGGFDAGGPQKKCTRIQPKNITTGMKNFLNSTKWQSRVKWDRLLFDAANQSLDITIESLGRSKFGRQLKFFQRAQAVANAKCAGNLKAPCSASREGLSPLSRKETDCLWKDSACGTACLDKVADELNLWNIPGEEDTSISEVQ